MNKFLFLFLTFIFLNGWAYCHRTIQQKSDAPKRQVFNGINSTVKGNSDTHIQNVTGADNINFTTPITIIGKKTTIKKVTTPIKQQTIMKNISRTTTPKSIANISFTTTYVVKKNNNSTTKSSLSNTTLSSASSSFITTTKGPNKKNYVIQTPVSTNKIVKFPNTTIKPFVAIKNTSTLGLFSQKTNLTTKNVNESNAGDTNVVRSKKMSDPYGTALWTVYNETKKSINPEDELLSLIGQVLLLLTTFLLILSMVLYQIRTILSITIQFPQRQSNKKQPETGPNHKEFAIGLNEYPSDKSGNAPEQHHK